MIFYLFFLYFPTLVYSACHYIDAFWMVRYVGLKKYDPENSPEPPAVFQTGMKSVNISWAHIIEDSHCVDRYVVHVWDVKKNHIRYIFNSSIFTAVLEVPRCTSLKVELQEDDKPGKPPDSRMTFPAPVALVTKWIEEPKYTINRSLVEVDKSFSHWSQIFDPSTIRGIEVDWSASLINSVCISTGEIVVSRLVVGAISDTVKKIKVPVVYSDERSTLSLPCQDSILYNINVNFYQNVKVNGRLERYVAKSKEHSILLQCPWTEGYSSANAVEYSRIMLVAFLTLFIIRIC
ncbi:uncharacterized protein LOC111702132 isoform X2 [Eurytemora carolleeae]|uniref:uncharacterized protein LOC111702132 isoform X2 n=1 Tax=Eurytemora carolleeae TaxID=1294199 RepID=UPI000C762701|nr:uncharacterized protein LOC111702132 isoform X2 [Eurytemora carolleeae]|eukprot:XP_023329481.1 uncharacterized protein LOC111702132 isoform X2 [Eurytemora affinis]